jgi:hypothetical protein
MRIQSAGVEVLPLEALRNLPEAGEIDSGIYFLWLGDELRYVGKSENVRNRYAAQLQTNRFHSVRGSYRLRPIPCDRHTCLVLHSEPFIENRPELERTLQRYERAYIAHYEPPDNDLYASPNT